MYFCVWIVLNLICMVWMSAWKNLITRVWSFLGNSIIHNINLLSMWQSGKNYVTFFSWFHAFKRDHNFGVKWEYKRKEINSNEKHIGHQPRSQAHFVEDARHPIANKPIRFCERTFETPAFICRPSHLNSTCSYIDVKNLQIFRNWSMGFSKNPLNRSFRSLESPILAE